MKTLLTIFFVATFLLTITNYSYAFEDTDPEFMSDDEYDYESNSVKSNSHLYPKTETKESYRYDVSVDNFVNVHYTSTKVTTES